MGIREKNLLKRITIDLTLLVALLAIICTLKGIFDPSVYGELLRTGNLSENLYSGSIAQDLLILPISIILLLLTIVLHIIDCIRIFIAVLGLVWCEFYAFGLYVIQGQYTKLYLLYLVIFGVSIYTLIIGLVSFRSISNKVELQKGVRLSVGVFMMSIILILIPVWIIRITTNISVNQAPETYGVFVLDLCVVFPAILIITLLLLRNNSLGKIMAGVALIKIFSLCLIWGFAEIYVSVVRHTPIALEMVGISGFFTLVSGILLIPYFRSLKIISPYL